jgi:hypothetical protein
MLKHGWFTNSNPLSRSFNICQAPQDIDSEIRSKFRTCFVRIFTDDHHVRQHVIQSDAATVQLNMGPPETARFIPSPSTSSTASTIVLSLILGFLVVYLVQWAIEPCHDTREPPHIRSRFPVLGHIGTLPTRGKKHITNL